MGKDRGNLLQKNVDPGQTPRVNKGSLTMKSPSLINPHKNNMYSKWRMPLWTLRARRRLISCGIDHRFCILNDLPHFLYLFCIFIVMCADHGQVTTFNYFKIKKNDGFLFWCMHSAFCHASSRHCSGAALMGPESLKPWNYSIRTYSLPRISSLPVRRSRTRVICSHWAESNGRQPDTKDVSRGRGKANKKKRSEGHLLTYRQCMSTGKHQPIPSSNS